jgi:hypothetical protein
MGHSNGGPYWRQARRTTSTEFSSVERMQHFADAMAIRDANEQLIGKNAATFYWRSSVIRL